MSIYWGDTVRASWLSGWSEEPQGVAWEAHGATKPQESRKAKGQLTKTLIDIY